MGAKREGRRPAGIFILKGNGGVTSAISNLIGPPLSDIGRSKELLLFDIDKARNLIKKYGIPAKENYDLAVIYGSKQSN